MANVTAKTEHHFDRLGPGAVYDAWLDPAKLRKWMEHHTKERDPSADVTKIEVDPVVGGRFAFADTREDSEAWGYYRVLEPGKRIVFTWFVTAEEEEEDNSTVTLELRRAGDGCVATMSHEMDEEWADYIEPTAKAWKSMLEAIDQTFS